MPKGSLRKGSLRKENLLLVEGIGDKSFFEEFCSREVLTITSVSPPTEVGGTYNSKQGVLNHLATLLKQLEDGELKGLGLVVDADLHLHGQGFDKTLAAVTAVTQRFDKGYSCRSLDSGGFIFKRNDGLPDVGLWIMPNNQDDGAIESWIIETITGTSKALFNTAEAAVDDLDKPLFNESTRRKKADLATWLAWQKNPGEGLYYTVKGSLLDCNAPLYTELKCWVEAVFPQAK